MAYYAPGVYIEEVPSGPQPIAAAPTSVVAVLGTTRRGPVGVPTRVTGWSDFVRTFGPATARGFTAESVFGFFENGGPAAWVVRVDPSTPASWRVLDADGVESFAITATSPGTWANDVAIGVRADEAGAAGGFYRGVTTGATVDVTTSGTHAVQVTSTAGLRPGDAIVLVGAPESGAATGAVTGAAVSVTGTTIELSADAAVTLPAGSVVASAVTAGATTVFLPTGNGFKEGDVVILTAPDGTRVSAVADAVTKSGSAVTLTLTGLGAAVPGAALVQRRAAFEVTATPTGTPTTDTPPITAVPLSQLTFASPATAPVSGDLGATAGVRDVARITFADGRTAPWVAAASRFEVVGSTVPPSGPATLVAGVDAVLFTDTGLALESFTAAGLRDAYAFLPDGAAIELTGPGVAAIRLERAGTTFTLSATPAAGDVYTAATFVLPTTGGSDLVVRSAVAPRVGDHLTLDGTAEQVTGVAAQGGDVYVVSFAAAAGPPAASQTRFPLLAVESASVAAHRFALDVDVAGVRVESFDGLSLSESHPGYVAKDDVVNDASAYLRVAPRAPGAPAVSLAATPFYAEVAQLGADRPATNEDYRLALEALEAQTEPALLIAPDAVTQPDLLLHADLVGRLVTHAERFRRFAVIDAPDLADDVALLAWRNATVASTSAAVFAPHLTMVTIDPDSIDRFTTVPPSGFVAGVFARTDRERGVHKAPGNERVSGIVGLTQTYTQRRQDLLNPGGVNLIRTFAGRGSRLWGARNATDDATWRYINVRRLFNMIETSVDQSTQWVVFEPNTASTWIRVKTSVENFLDQQWRAGALAGTKPEEAYRVRVGLGETMTETDIDLGLIITEVAIAPAKPAEFVVFRFSHKRLSE